MTKRTWIILLALVWLAVSAAIVARAFVRLNARGSSGTAYFHTPVATIDGTPAYALQYVEHAIVGTYPESAWERLAFSIVPETQRPSDLSDRSQYWEATAIVKPFHLMFRKPDGTPTGPHRVEFLSPGCAEWSADGMSWQFYSGTSPFLNRQFQPEGRVWNPSVTRQFVARQIAYILMAGAAIAMIGWTVWFTRASLRHGNPDSCEACGYDLRGGIGPGCPECGHGKNASPRCTGKK